MDDTENLGERDATLEHEVAFVRVQHELPAQDPADLEILFDHPRGLVPPGGGLIDVGRVCFGGNADTFVIARPA